MKNAVNGVVTLACLCVLPSALATNITYEMVTVGNPGNPNDTTGYGAVGYSYQVGKYVVTIGQYIAFLNAVAATDTHSLYNANMATNLNVAGISRSGSSGSYAYSVIGSPNRPITYLSWFDSARFANWMANGQPTGAQTSTTTENGAYNVNGFPPNSGIAPAKNATNPNTNASPTFYIPTENEWYKAAYFSPNLNSGAGGYYTWATQSQTAPGNVVGSAANQANYIRSARYSVTQSFSYSSSQNYLTDVGAFTNSASFYGTFDQSGNVFQWTDLDGLRGTKGRRGGSWSNSAVLVSSSNRATQPPGSEDSAYYGLRLASPVLSAVPEIDPSSFGSAWALVVGALGLLERRRSR